MTDNERRTRLVDRFKDEVAEETARLVIERLQAENPGPFVLRAVCAERSGTIKRMLIGLYLAIISVCLVAILGCSTYRVGSRTSVSSADGTAMVEKMYEETHYTKPDGWPE